MNIESLRFTTRTGALIGRARIKAPTGSIKGNKKEGYYFIVRGL